MLADSARARGAMVERQLKRRGISDPKLTAAMGRVPREKFLPAPLAEFAYEDVPLPIAAAQTIVQPYLVALMAEALALERDDRVLEVGTGTGYAAAVLAELAGEVFTVERHRGLAEAARDRLEALGYRNVQVRCSDGALGWPEEAPFDAIVVTAGGPEIARALYEQLAVGGRLVMTVGGCERLQRLKLVRREDRTSYRDADLGPVRIVPLGTGELSAPHNGRARAADRALGVGPALRQLPRGRRSQTPARVVAEAAEPFDSIETADLEPLLARIGGARVILLGAATHGTAEFYAMRARITQALIERAGVRIVAVEADWPDAREVDRFTRGEPGAQDPERAFTRFPTWMWANREVARFARWLRDFNEANAAPAQARFYGLDLYSLHDSIRAVLAYLDDRDPRAAKIARARYGCLEPWESDPAAYGAAALEQGFEHCAAGVVKVLDDLLRRRLAYVGEDRDDFFAAERNAALVKNAERYYRALYYGSRSSWNLRDGHMFETLHALLRCAGPEARAVVWAHNSHLGNAAATALSARGETNLGELCRDAFGASCYAIGCGTDRGTVAAAREWGGPVEPMQVRPAHEASYERVCHESGVRRFLLPLRAADRAEAHAALADERLERAIGVVYRPRAELASHYFEASLPRQFDEWLWFDESRAVEPLQVADDDAKTPSTFPFGL